MAENWKHLYEQTKKMLAMYQDEIVPGFRGQIEKLENNSVEVVRCRDCKHWDDGICSFHSLDQSEYAPAWGVAMLHCDFCSYGERKDNDIAESD